MACTDLNRIQTSRIFSFRQQFTKSTIDSKSETFWKQINETLSILGSQINTDLGNFEITQNICIVWGIVIFMSESFTEFCLIKP